MGQYILPQIPLMSIRTHTPWKFVFILDDRKLVETLQSIFVSIEFEINCCVKGGYLDFSHLTELKNIYIINVCLKKNNNNDQ